MSLSRFGVRHPVPVNLLMIATIVAGFWCGLSLRREFFPESEPEQAIITMPYPGATAEEIEQTLAIKVEDALAGLDEIKKMTTTLSDGGGGIVVEFREDIDVDKALDKVEREIDSLRDLPEESEQIQVELFEPRLPVIIVAVYGNLDEAVMKDAVRGIRDDLRRLPGMGEIAVGGVREDEIRVDVDRDALVRYGISLPQISQSIGAAMLDVPGGTVRGDTGNVKVRTVGVDEQAQLIRGIEMRSRRDGATVRVDDLARVSDSFVDEQIVTRCNGKPAAMLTAFAVGDQDIVQIAQMVRAYVAARQGEPFHATFMERFFDTPRHQAWMLGALSSEPLPPGASLTTFTDLARFVEGRLDLLKRNAMFGAVLVFLVLLSILNWRVAVWVGAGLVTAVCGTLVLMYSLDITLNLLTMFGLIIVLGLLVDDAIVVAENIQSRHDRGEPTQEAAIKGAEQVLWPVVATVLTTVVAFLPLSFVKGQIGDMLGALPMVVSCALLMSLIESLLILPSHMGHTLERMDARLPGRLSGVLRRFEQKRDGWLFDWLIPHYCRWIDRAIRYRYISVSLAAAILIVSLGMVAGERVPFTFLTTSDSETLIVNVHMPIGTPIEQTNRIVQRIEAAAATQPEVSNVVSDIGESSNIDTGQTEMRAQHIAQMFIELLPVEQRDRESSKVSASIREALAGQLDEVERISFSEITGGPGGADISLEFRGNHQDKIVAAARRFKLMLAEYAGVTDIADDNDTGQLELQFELRDGADALGFTRASVAQQVRGALFGLEAHVFAGDQEDVKVRVRFDEPTRQSLYAIENSWLISPRTGAAVPLSEVVNVKETTTFSTIRRIDRQRAVTVFAYCLPGYNPEQIFNDIDLDSLRRQFPSVTIAPTGRQQQMSDAFGSLPYGFLAAILMIYVILAWLFADYLQPLIVLLAVPFAVVGVIWGHWLLGYEMTFLTMIGFVALSGIVVNDSLILVEFFNAQRRTGKSLHDALIAAGRARLRAIVLTTVTTVFGLLPLILERSFQAKFLIPMAIAIAGGLISATLLILVVLPCMMKVLDDIKRLFHLSWYGRALPHERDLE